MITVAIALTSLLQKKKFCREVRKRLEQIRKKPSKGPYKRSWRATARMNSHPLCLLSSISGWDRPSRAEGQWRICSLVKNHWSAGSAIIELGILVDPGVGYEGVEVVLILSSAFARTKRKSRTKKETKRESKTKKERGRKRKKKNPELGSSRKKREKRQKKERK